MEVRCPNCRGLVSVDSESSLSGMVCSSCGSEISLVGGDDTLVNDEKEAARIAHFEFIERVGSGSFGTVWKAKDTNLQRTVAVKLPRIGRLTPKETERFLREARAAARLKHPNIVAVHEVGRQDDVAYIVSDFVEGVTLADWLSGRSVTYRDAAQVCRKIARSLEHAHTLGVVHRDLKPANIMLDAEQEPHLMDFGLAKQEAVDATLTIDGRLLGSPAYMSPEQARGEARNVDGRSDIYSLGVILYELLTGQRPFRGNVRLLIHQVLHDEPPAPRSITPEIPRDLETITLKCLEKEPERRYSSAAELAEELERFLNNKPIRSRPVSRLERGWRWCRRNTLAAVLTAVLVVTLLALAIGGPLAAIKNFEIAERAQKAKDAEARTRGQLEEALKAARQAKTRADAEAKAATEVSDFLSELLRQTKPISMFGADSRFTLATGKQNPRDLLDQGAKEIDRLSKGSPKNRAKLMDTIGEVYSFVGNLDAADRFLKVALDLRRRFVATADNKANQMDLATTLHNLAFLRFVQGRYSEAASRIADALKIRNKHLGEDHVNTLATRFLQALILGGDPRHEDDVAARSVLRKMRKTLYDVLERRKKRVGETHPDIGNTRLMLAAMEMGLGNNLTALRQIAMANWTFFKLKIDDHPGQIVALVVEAKIASALRRFDSQDKFITAAVSKSRAYFGELHPASLSVEAELAGHYRDRSQAEKMLREAARKARRVFGRQPRVAVTLNALADVLYETNHIEEAEDLERESLSICEENFPKGDWIIARGEMRLARVLATQGKLEEAERRARAAIATFERLGLISYEKLGYAAQKELSRILALRGKFRESATAAKQAIERRKQYIKQQKNAG